MPEVWKNRIVSQQEVSVAELKANPKNWRKHSQFQAAALDGVLSEVGLVQNVIFNRTTDRLVDGHLRVELAAKRGQKTLPVTIVDLSEEEEALILATFDPISALAQEDEEKLKALCAEIPLHDEELGALLGKLAAE